MVAKNFKVLLKSQNNNINVKVIHNFQRQQKTENNKAGFDHSLEDQNV